MSTSRNPSSPRFADSSNGRQSPRPDAPAVTAEEHSLLALVELSKELNTPLDLYGLADVGLLNLMGSLGTQSAVLWVFPNGPDEPAVLLRAFGIPDKTARSLGRLCTKDMAARFAGKTSPLFLEDLDEILDDPARALVRQHSLALFAGLQAREGLLGVIALGERLGGLPIENFQVRVLEASLYHLGVALENSILYSSLHENNRVLRLAKERLEEHDEIQREFLSNLDHELRTPLTVMISYLDMIRTQLAENVELVELLDVVVEQTNKLKDMILGLLDFSSVGKGRLVFDMAEGNVVDAFTAYVEDRRPGVSRGFRELVFTVRSKDLVARFDRERLFQVMDALIDNAEKFTPQGTHIELRIDDIVAFGRSWVRVRVIDDGPGIASDKLDRIFQLFRQVDGSSTRSVGGMGMGLPLARAFVESMEGRLEVASEPGKGTTCLIILPRIGAPAPEDDEVGAASR
jgi:signal transduction histidine kinase